MALKLVDGNGNKLFSRDARGNLKENTVKDVQYVDSVKYLVTNTKINGNYRIPIIDVSNATPIDISDKTQTNKLFETIGNQLFHFFGGTGLVTKYDKQRAIRRGKEMWKQLMHGHGFSRKNKSITRRKVIAMLPQVLPGCIYIDKHDDVVHGTDTKYIEAFVPIKDGNKISIYQFTAKEQGNAKDNDVGLAVFYNLKEGKPTVLQSGNVIDFPSEMSITEMLEGIKDRNGNPYVINGVLQYGPSVLAEIQAEEKAKAEAEARASEKDTEKYSVDLNDLSQGKVFDDALKNAMASRVQEKSEIAKVLLLCVRLHIIEMKTKTKICGRKGDRLWLNRRICMHGSSRI